MPAKVRTGVEVQTGEHLAAILLIIRVIRSCTRAKPVGDRCALQGERGVGFDERVGCGVADSISSPFLLAPPSS